jgi:N-glycosylase/DNA lyase
MRADVHSRFFAVRNYNLGETLASGQTFRWMPQGEIWTGVLGRHWLKLAGDDRGITAHAAEPIEDWTFLEEFLQLNEDLESVIRTFPDDPQMRAAMASCSGLRLLRQDPWECLASFILSATKQIVQIQQVITLLCERFGEPITVPAGASQAWSFPSPARLAEVAESDLRGCKMGFRAPYLRSVARQVAEGAFDLNVVRLLPQEEARDRLVTLPGVGPKIADCVLLFAYGFHTAFPMDVWILRALKELYFPKRRPTLKRLRRFAGTYFGPRSGYAQQYLFHYMRTLRL